MGCAESSPENPLPSRPASSQVRYEVLGLLCAAAAISYTSRNGLGVVESTIRKDLMVDKETTGLVIALFYLTYALGQLPGGWLADRLGVRRALPLLALTWSVATAAMGLARGWWALAAGSALNGLAQAGLFPGCTGAFSRWFPPTQRAVASGWLASSMSLGSSLASSLAALLLTQAGWRWTLVLFGSAGVVWAVQFYYLFRDRPQEHRRVSDRELDWIGQPDPSRSASVASPGSVAAEHAWLALLSSPATWFICGQQFCRAGGQIFFSSWFPTYLQEARGVSVANSGFLNSLPLLAIVTGSLLGGMFSDWVLTRTGSRRWGRQGVASGCMITCSVFVFAASQVADPLWAVTVISLGTLLGAVGGPAAYAITIDMGEKHVAKLFGCMNMVGNLGAALVTYMVPRLQRWTGDWDQVLFLFGGLWLGAGFFWLLLNPEGNVFRYSLWGPNRSRA